MTFILVTGSIMAVSIFLIYHLCRFVGIEIKWISLVLCAFLAFLVNVTAISMSPFLDRSHYLRLGVLVIAAAAFVTFFNERLLQREEKNTAAKEAVPLPWTAEQPVLAAACTGDSAHNLPDASTAAPLSIQPAPEKQPDKPETAEPSPKEETDAPSQAPSESLTEEAAKAEALAKAKALAKEKARQAEEENEARRRAAAAKAKEAALQKAREEEAAAKAKEAALRKAREEEAATKAKEAALRKAREEEAAAKAKEAALRQEIAGLDSLDGILDYAYDHAESSPEAAICAYREAIARYPDDSYTPFLVIELGNLYKGQADYAKAIEAYRQALSLPVIAANDAMKQEFIKNTRYLAIVQNILSKHHALATPFPDISADILQEIETEFQQSS